MCLKSKWLSPFLIRPENGEIVVAYEPIWAIGTGLTPTVGDVEEAHKFMREELVKRALVKRAIKSVCFMAVRLNLQMRLN